MTLASTASTAMVIIDYTNTTAMESYINIKCVRKK